MSSPSQTIDATHVPVARLVAPVTGWRRALADWLLVGGTTVFCHVVGAVTSVLLRVMLDPARMGVWQGLKMLLGYANYSNLGISKGAVRELTIARGSGDETRAREGLNLAFTVNTLTSVVYAAGVVAVGLWMANRGGRFAGIWSWGLIVMGLLAVASRYVTFHVTILRGQQSFGVTSRLSAIEAVLTLSVGGLATWRWGLPGLYLGALVVMLASLVYVWRYRGASLRWAWNTAEIRRLIGIGGPILLATTLFTLFRSLDRLMILAYLSDREYQLGCYSLALMVGAQLYGLGCITCTVMSPRYGEKLGASDDRVEVARLAARTGELQAVAMSLVGGLSMVLAAPVLGWLLPRYQLGLAPTCWLIPGAVLLTIALPVNHYLIAINRQRRALAVVAVAVALAALGNHVALRAGWGLVGVAAATTASYACYFVLVVGVSLWIDLPPGERARYLGLTALALLPTMLAGTFFATGHDSTGAVDWPSLAAQTACVIAVWSASSAVIWRFGGWSSLHLLKPQMNTDEHR
ncbi:MAG TPA: oligosaccharide flippase family protein [Thermoguttaceae bacterium]|nr:oligosaccharide flippase family protein [Thermoguttaceae bacterium]